MDSSVPAAPGSTRSTKVTTGTPKVIVVEKPKRWQLALPDAEVIAPDRYLGESAYQSVKNLRVINLCKSYQYQSEGYYVSLLAEARGHQVLPKIATLQDFRFPSILREDALDIDEMIQSSLKNEDQERVEFNIYFGSTSALHLNKLAGQVFQLVQVPLLRVIFSRKQKWVLTSLKPINLTDVPVEDLATLELSLEKFLQRRRDIRIDKKKYDLAILVNHQEKNPPSDSKALKKFQKAAVDVGFNVELITKNDFDQLIQYDALLIRETTHVNHHTFRFAKKAESLGLAVIDDPVSILKCTNKVYLYELLQANDVLTPVTMVVTSDNYHSLPEKMPFPFILKQPDGAFSKGVFKIESAKDFMRIGKKMFEESDLLIAQEFVPTPFDWRVGIINHKVIFVCKYFMASRHWQILNWNAPSSSNRVGAAEAVPVEQAPPALLETALKAASLIGDGLYGVDLKEVNSRFYVIEINDNPNIDAGVEDKILKEQLYSMIIDVLLTKVRSSK